MTLSPTAVMSRVPRGILPLPAEWLAPESPLEITAGKHKRHAESAAQ